MKGGVLSLIGVLLIGTLIISTDLPFMAQSAAPTRRATIMEELGYPQSARLLVIEAEDLGMAHSIDKASFQALENNWVTAAGVLVPAPWFPEVLRWSRNHPNADLGIRLDLNSDWSSYRWRPVSGSLGPSGVSDAGGYLSSSPHYVASHATIEEAQKEERAQIELAKKAGMRITHLDNHMRTLTMTPAMFQTYWTMGEENELPIVLPRELVLSRASHTENAGVYSFGGVDIDIRRLLIDRELEIMPGLSEKDWLGAYKKSLESLPPGVYLLSVHLGFSDEELKAMTWDHPNWGAEWRQNDYNVISSIEFQEFLKQQGFILVNWKDLQKATGPRQ
jgi:chitin disaccharide deacetylase